jgi:hypothetical protein
MSEPRPDTDEHREPAGTPSPGPDDLTARPVVPGQDDGAPTAVPGAYEADEDEQARGREWKPGN